jgi:hypothetical protein
MKLSTALVLIAAALALAIAWFAGLSGDRKGLLTSEYTRALAAGHTYLGIQPDPRLLALRDPYDPAKNQAYRLVDASLFNGRYYLYFGIVPFITVLVPWLLLTGHQLPDSALSAAYCIGAMLCLSAILGSAIRRHFPRLGFVSLAIGILTGSIASGALILVRDPNIYQLAIAAAYFHDFAALLAAYVALHDPKRARLWLALAALNAGLAVGCRPSHVIVAAAFALFIAGECFRRGTSRRTRWQALLLTTAPLAAVAMALGWFNWFRFNSPFDFGILHALVNSEGSKTSFVGARFVPYNLWLYLFGWPRWSPWFPFFLRTAVPPFGAPRDYNMEQVYGMFVIAPFVLCAAALFSRWGRIPVVLRRFLVLALSIGAGNLMFLTMIDGANARYSVDFLPCFLLAAGFGLFVMVDDQKTGRGPPGVAPVGVALAVFSVLASVCTAFSFGGITRAVNVKEFERAGYIFNQPRFLWQRVCRTPLSAFRVTTTLPKDRFGSVEPLLVTGPRSQQDFIYLYYAAPGVLRVGFEAIGRGGPVSDLVPVDYSGPVTIDLELGFGWPPPGAPVYGGLRDTDVETIRRRLGVKINGVTALDCWVSYHDAQAIYNWGRSPYDPAFGSAYTGSTLQITEVPLPAIEAQPENRAQTYGPLRIEISRSQNAGGVEPLVAIGYSKRWQLLSVVYEGEDKARIVETDSETAGERSSPAVTFTAGGRHFMTISAGGLFPPLESHLWGNMPMTQREALRDNVKIDLDGVSILRGTSEAPETGPTSIAIGKNTLLLSGIRPAFSGKAALIDRGTLGN